MYTHFVSKLHFNSKGTSKGTCATIIVRGRALRTCAHLGPRMHMPAQTDIWVEVAEGIVVIERGGAKHCPSPRRQPQQLEEHAMATCTASPRTHLPLIDRIPRREG